MPKRQNEPKTSTGSRLTRTQAARVLGLTVSGVRHLEATRRLRARRGADGVHKFRAEDVEALRGQVQPRSRSSASEPSPATSSSGPVAARAFQLLEEGADWRELVRVLELSPDDARALVDGYRAPATELVLPAGVVDELAALGAVDAAGVVSGRSIVALVRRLRERVRQRLHDQRRAPFDAPKHVLEGVAEPRDR